MSTCKIMSTGKIKRKIKRKASFEKVASLLQYDPETGSVTWKNHRRGLAKAGDIAGARVYMRCGDEQQPYRQITIDGVAYWSHHIAWLLHYGEWPTHSVVHIDGDPENNRIDNLRATRNTKPETASVRSGVDHAFWHRQTGKWYVCIGTTRVPGLYATAHDAKRAVRKFIKK